jgi:hypothetical protein
MSTAEKIKVDATRAAETVRDARDSACAAAAREDAQVLTFLSDADERKGSRGQRRRRGEVALHHGAREGGASRAEAAAASAAPGLRQHASPRRRAPLRHIPHA